MSFQFKLTLVNYIKRFGGPDDELKSIQDNLRRLQQKENLYASIENLRVSVSTKDAIARIESAIGNLTLNIAPEKM